MYVCMRMLHRRVISIQEYLHQCWHHQGLAFKDSSRYVCVCATEACEKHNGWDIMKRNAHQAK